ncbi:hypothetical protein GCM10010466_31060 [Planomonospora alba]|uniref:Anti-sigma factor n=1 Tax=Planomonospora alba TaxID=161354 RepID=R4ZCX2_9ACTN|nr:anti-sigma factor [Planomonospora alba]
MTEHCPDDVLARLARTGPDGRGQRHLDDCSDCRRRLALWRDVASVMRTEAAEQAAALPPFDLLLGPALAGAEAGTRPSAAFSAVAATAASGRARRANRPWRTAWQLVTGQAVLMPRSWIPLSAAGFAGATLLAHVQERFGLRLFGAVAVLVVLFGALTAASPRRDPRRELLFTLPISPTVVFLGRMTVVLCADVVLAMICSTLVDGPGWWGVVSSWLGEALLAASLALALSVRIAPAAGAAAGGALWVLGVVSGPEGLFATPVDGLLGMLTSTTPWTLVLAAALLGWAAGAMRSLTGTASAAWSPRSADGSDRL